MIVLYFIGYAALSAFLFYRVQGAYILKILSVSYLFFLASAVYFSVDSFKGWPAETEPANGALVVAIQVDEPREGSEGAIYVWSWLPPESKNFAITWFNPWMALKQDQLQKPRVFTIPYSELSAKSADKARKALEEGRTVTYRNKNDMDGEGGDGAEGEGEGGELNGGGVEYYPNSNNTGFIMQKPESAPRKN